MGDAGATRHHGAPADCAPTRPLGVRIGYAVGVTSGRRAALLAAVICVLILSVAVPLRNYVGQRAELSAVYEQQQILTDKIGELERRRVLLADPEHIETQARERLRYVRPGEAPYLVQLPPGEAVAVAGGVPSPAAPWYSQLWKSINSG
ncbi:MAG: septum formation initiator family protein [Pseudonocardiales bacterium]|nr:septum formation initiator family protein [Pseudonocardiales bacterium]